MRLVKIFFLSMMSFCALAQNDDQEIVQPDPKAEQKIKAAHAAYITERLELTPEEAEKFWPGVSRVCTKASGNPSAAEDR
jgi:hypothetical protein